MEALGNSPAVATAVKDALCFRYMEYEFDAANRNTHSANGVLLDKDLHQ